MHTLINLVGPGMDAYSASKLNMQSLHGKLFCTLYNRMRDFLLSLGEENYDLLHLICFENCSSVDSTKFKIF